MPGLPVHYQLPEFTLFICHKNPAGWVLFHPVFVHEGTERLRNFPEVTQRSLGGPCTLTVVDTPSPPHP